MKKYFFEEINIVPRKDKKIVITFADNDMEISSRTSLRENTSKTQIKDLFENIKKMRKQLLTINPTELQKLTELVELHPLSLAVVLPQHSPGRYFISFEKWQGGTTTFPYQASEYNFSFDEIKKLFEVKIEK